MQPNYGLLDPYGVQGDDSFGMMGLGEEDGGPDMDGGLSSDYNSAQNLDASQFLDDFDMFRQAGPLLVNDDDDDEQIDPEEELAEEELVANDIEAGGPSNYYPSPDSFNNFMDQFDQSGVNFQQPGMEEAGWTSVNPDAGNNDFADFMMSSRQGYILCISIIIFHNHNSRDSRCFTVDGGWGLEGMGFHCPLRYESPSITIMDYIF